MAEFTAAGLSATLNNLLRRAGIQIVRVPTLNRLVWTEQKHVAQSQSIAVEVASLLADREDLKSRLAALEAGTAQSIQNLTPRLSALETSTDQSIRNLVRYAMKAHWRTLDMVDQITGADRPDSCPLCGYTASPEKFRELESVCDFNGGRLLRHECPNCNVIFGPQKMFALDAEMLDLDYRLLYRIYSEGHTTESVIRTFHLLKPRKDGVYLDFGSGGEWSEAIQRLRSEGWNIYGFEPSANHSSEHVFSGWDELTGKKFDGILSHNVIEHVFDPVGVTRKLGDMLTDDGRIVHATACFDYRYERTHYHVYFFTGRSPDVLAEKAGMHIVDWVRDEEYIACTLQKKVQTAGASA